MAVSTDSTNRAVSGLDRDPVLEGVEDRGARPGEGRGVGDEVVHAPLLQAAGQAPGVALGLDAFEDRRPVHVRGLRHGERDRHDPARMGGEDAIPDGRRGVVPDLLARLRVEAGGDVAEPYLEVVGELGHGAHRRAGGPDRVGLLDGDGRADVLDRVDPRLVEQVQELPDVGAERLDVAPLALRVEGLEHQGALPGAAEPRDHDVAPQGHVEVEALEVVLAHAAEADALREGFFARACQGR
jgi:hypothetical protein